MFFNLSLWPKKLPKINVKYTEKKKKKTLTFQNWPILDGSYRVWLYDMDWT